MRSELAVPVWYDSHLIGVLNLESEHEDAFAQQHVDTCLWIATHLAPWIAAIRDRIETDSARERALNTIMDSYVEGFARVLWHNSGNALAGHLASLENIERKYGPASPHLKQSLADAIDAGRQFDKLLETFVFETQGASQFGEYSVSGLINGATELLRDLQWRLLERFQVKVEVSPYEEVTIYCSKLFRHHLYNVLNNSLFWVSKRLEERPSPPGLICVQIKRVQQGDEFQERELNERCEIRVWDNGLGVPAEVLQRLQGAERLSLRKKEEGGHGYGLWTLRQYLAGIGGWIDLDSAQNEFFEVRLLLDLYRPWVHNALEQE
jgi:signal transduction histidine kinase